MYKINEEAIRNHPDFNKDITFNGFPVIMEVISEEVYIGCKTIKGTLTEMERFFNNRGVIQSTFGGAKIRLWNRGMVKIDCLEETIEVVKIILIRAKDLKDEFKDTSCR